MSQGGALTFTDAVEKHGSLLKEKNLGGSVQEGGQVLHWSAGPTLCGPGNIRYLQIILLVR